MSYRYMRVIVLFDLPMVTSKERKSYRYFRRFLLKSGFIMLQQSVYSKLAHNPTVANTIANNVREEAPEKGLVQLLIITEKQFARIEYVVGEQHTGTLDSIDRVVIL